MTNVLVTFVLLFGLHWFLNRREGGRLGVVSGGWGLVGGGVSVSLLWLWWVDWGSLVGDISDESVDVVSGVGGGLDSAVGKSDHERSGDDTVSVLGLGLLEVGFAVVISNSVLVGEWLRGEFLLLVWGGLVVSGSWSVSWGGGVSWSWAVSSGEGHEGGGEDNLKIFFS